jgi:hypothetical protein
MAQCKLSFAMSQGLSARINSKTFERILIKFYVRELFENLSTHSTSGLYLGEVIDNSCEHFYAHILA